MTAPKDPAHNLADALELLERHIAILRTVKENQPIGLIRLSEMTGIPKHRVRYSLKILEQQGIIVPTSDGATVSDGYEAFMDDMADSVEEFAYKVAALRDVLRNRLRPIHLFSIHASAPSGMHRIAGLMLGRSARPVALARPGRPATGA